MNGKFELESQENFETFMKAIGLHEDLVEVAKDIKSTNEIEQNGNHVIFTITIGPKVIRNEFNVGEEAELETLTGDRVKSVVQLEGNKLIMNLKGIHGVAEVNGDTLTNGSTGTGWT
uniref:Cytosolic fatty-acid binding proteins domain-containing protein n=1 Tax=Leptobrachium leishanense TaxID=445787 RepID=A0A8C5M5J9_9ANUR